MNDQEPRTYGSAGQPLIFTDLKNATSIHSLDLNRFSLHLGSSLSIVPREGVLFDKVTVRVSDLFNRVLAHEHAVDPLGMQQWVFTYLHVRIEVPLGHRLCQGGDA